MKLATIETISEIRNHANADRLELAKVLGWQSVVKKGDFKVGDRVVFVVIDTVLPRCAWSEFLVNPKAPDAAIRLRTIKLRGEYSQGLVLPLSVLPEHVQGWQDGCDVGGELGIKKYEKEISLALSGVAKGAFPQYLVSKTDEDNGLSNPWLVEEVEKQGSLIATMKLDGSSGTVIVEDGKILEVCSRNLSLLESDGNAFWAAARKLDLSKATGRWVIQGELMGPGVQGNQLGLKAPELYVFQVKDRARGQWLSRVALEHVCSDMGAKIVPVIQHSGGNGLDYWQSVADGLKLDNGKPAEGVVVRNDPPISSGIGRPLGFKIINRNYGE